MRRSLLGWLPLALLTTGFAPLPAAAQDALYLGWGECGSSAAMQQTSTCASSTGDQKLYAAFSLAQALDQVVGVEIVVDISHADPVLPAWWQLGVGGCRAGALSANGETPEGSGCVDFWMGQASGDVQSYVVGQPRGGPNQARIRVALSLLPANARALEAGTVYYAARLVLGNQATTGAGSCAGCGGDACLVLNSIWIKRLPGAPGGDVFVTTPSITGNMATWQGTGADCEAVPVQTSSWGRIKTLYR